MADIVRPRGFRWWLFKRLSAIGWWVCPEPHRSVLLRFRPEWSAVEGVLQATHREAKGGGE